MWHQILRLSDGGEVCLDWLDCEKEKNKKHPTVLFLPGLTGDAQSEYIKVSFIDTSKYKMEVILIWNIEKFMECQKLISFSEFC